MRPFMSGCWRKDAGAEGRMCGIYGLVALRHGANCNPALLKAMALATQHRGPDDEGQYTDRGLAWECGGFRSSSQHGAPADSQRGRDELGDLQRRDLQLP